MRRDKLVLISIAIALAALLHAPGSVARPVATPAQEAATEPRTYVFVHGAWGGGWAFKPVESLLREQGHAVYRPTLTGLGERVHLAHPDVDLNTHIDDITNVILFEQLRDVILVGHSYGGMVVAGVAERIPELIGHIVLIDAILPLDGESASSAMGDFVGDYQEAAGDRADADYLVPLWVEEGDQLPHDVPQPLRTLIQPLFIGNPDAEAIPGTYILTVQPQEQEPDAFAPFAARAAERGWTVLEMAADHNPQWSHTAELAELLLAVR